VSQLARFSKEGRELEEYRQHLEKVYKLCPGCEDILANKLGEQDRKLANKLIEFKLERSRFNTSMSRVKISRSWLPFTQCMLAITIFSLLQDYEQFHIPVAIKDTLSPALNATLPLQTTISSYLDTMFPFISLSEVIAPFTDLVNLSLVLFTTSTILLVVSLYNKSFLNTLLYTTLLIAYSISAPHILQLSLAGVGVIIAVLSSPPAPHNTIITSKGSARLSDSFLHYQTPKAPAPEVDDTLTQALLDTSTTVSHAPTRRQTPLSQLPLQVPAPPQSLTPPEPVTQLFTSTPPITAAPMRTRNEFSFTHEFATQIDDDCDLSSLSLGEIPTSDNPRSPFSLSQYSSSSSTNSLFSPSRPLLHPSRLTNTSWVAGGYWTPPGQTQLQSISRSSSHSSGFVSGTPSLACPSPPGSLHNYCSPLVPGYPHPTPELDRFSVLSEPAYQFPHHPPLPRPYAASAMGSPQLLRRRQTLDDCLSEHSLDRQSQVSQTSQTSISQTKAGWSLTITVTPTGLILATSIAVNVGLAVMWLRQEVDGVQ